MGPPPWGREKYAKFSKNQNCPKIKIVLKSKSSKNQNRPKIKIVQKLKLSKKCLPLFWPLKKSPGPATNDLCRLVKPQKTIFSPSTIPTVI